MRRLSTMAMAALMALGIQRADACTGITLKTADGTSIPARTIEWGGSDLNSKYVIVPRGYTQLSYVPGGQKNGLQFTAKYGYVGLAVEQEEFVAEGLNEKGLSAGLFYFRATAGMRTTATPPARQASPTFSSCRGYWATSAPSTR